MQVYEINVGQSFTVDILEIMFLSVTVNTITSNGHAGIIRAFSLPDARTILAYLKSHGYSNATLNEKPIEIG